MNKNPLHLWFLGWAVTVLTTLGILFGACSTEEFTYLDATFGTSGKVTTDFSSRLDEAYAVALQSDGKILAAGKSRGTTWDFALARYNTDGSLDTTFNTTGMVTTDISSGNDVIRALAVQSDNKILAVGHTTSLRTSTTFALARYETDGSLDTTFGTNGLITTQVGASDSEAYAVTLQSDGGIVAAGHTRLNDDLDFALVRYDTNGALDPTFDSDGKLTLDFGNGDDRARAIGVQADQQLVVAGYAETTEEGYYDMATARYTSIGNLDPLFSSDGKVTTNLGTYLTSNSIAIPESNDYAQGMVIKSNGEILLGGYTLLNEVQYLTAVQYTIHGELDTHFNTYGVSTTEISGKSLFGNAIALLNNGPIIAGYSLTNSESDVVLIKYTPYGSLEFAFGSSGIINTDVGSSTDEIHAIAVQSDNKVIVVGSTASGIERDFLVLRYQP